MVYESRRAVSINDAYGIDGLVENFKVTVGMGLEVVLRACIATRGNSIALVDTVLVGGEGASESRIEMVQVVAVDPMSGLITRMISYDVDADDLDAAYTELDAQYLASLPPDDAAVAQVTVDVIDTINQADWTRFAELLGGVDTVTDHRLLGLGNPPLAEWIDATRTLAELMPGDRRTRLAAVHELAAPVALCEIQGSGRDQNGTPVQFEQLTVGRIEGGRVLALDLFDTRDLDAARVRFRELS